MSFWRFTEQSGDPPAPAPEGSKITGRFYTKLVTGILKPFIRDSNGIISDFEGPQGNIGPEGPIGPTGPPGTLAVQDVADIDDPTEIESLTLVGIGRDIIAHEIVGAGGGDKFTAYVYDANGPTKNAPFVMNTGDGGTTRWIASISSRTNFVPISADGSTFISPAQISKLSGIESNAAADQTDAEIKTAYENNANTNSFTDAEKTKLGGVATNATNTPLSSTAPINVTKSPASAGSSSEAARQDHKHDIATAPPSSIGSSNMEGVSASIARADHVHNHGNLGGGSVHADATPSVSGFMSGVDKTKLNGVEVGAQVNELIIKGFRPDELLNTDNADWAVSTTTVSTQDTNNNALMNRPFDDTTEEGAGLILTVPAGKTNLELRFKSRAETAPLGVSTVGLNFYVREIPDNGAVGAWSSGTQLNDISIPTNENFQYDSQQLTLSSLSITPGRLYQFQLTRIDPAGGSELSGDWNLLELGVGFS